MVNQWKYNKECLVSQTLRDQIQWVGIIFTLHIVKLLNNKMKYVIVVIKGKLSCLNIATTWMGHIVL